ncbi:MAG: hypothetical protein U5M72_04745 [Pseudomonas sp.]|nr:hypothetical protein [Pseudomonas sp.]
MNKAARMLDWPCAVARILSGGIPRTIPDCIRATAVVKDGGDE